MDEFINCSITLACAQLSEACHVDLTRPAPPPECDWPRRQTQRRTFTVPCHTTRGIAYIQFGSEVSQAIWESLYVTVDPLTVFGLQVVPDLGASDQHFVRFNVAWWIE